LFIGWQQHHRVRHTKICKLKGCVVSKLKISTPDNADHERRFRFLNGIRDPAGNKVVPLSGEIRSPVIAFPI